MNQLDRTVDGERAQKLVEIQTEIVVSELTDWCYESMVLGKDELDPAIVPDKNLLPMEVLTHQYLWIDFVTEKDYLVYFITTINHQKVLAKGIVVGHKLVCSDDKQ